MVLAVLCVVTVLVSFATMVPAWAAALSVTTPAAQSSPTGIALSLPMTATGGTAPYTWSATGLPTGLGINPGNGTISGTPSAVGSFAVVVTAKDTTNATATASFAWSTAVVVVTSPGNQTGPTGVAYSKAMSAQGGTTPYTWTATALPPGITINSTTGVLSGTPTTAGSYATKVTATDTAGAAGNASFTFVTGVIVTSPGSRGNATGTGIGIADLTVKAAGGTTVYTWTATGLPPGLTIDPATGVISGTPTTDGTYAVTARATDTASATGATGFTWNIGPAPQLTDPAPKRAPSG